MRSNLLISVAVSCLLLLPGSGFGADLPSLHQLLVAPSVTVQGIVLDRPALEAVYAQRGYARMWSQEQTGHILEILKASPTHGLNPADYHVEAITALLPQQGDEFDLLLTDGVMRYASDVRGGRISPRQVEGLRYSAHMPFDPVPAVLKAATAPDLLAFLKGLPPASPVYAGLVEVLAQLRQIEQAGGWGEVADGRRIEPGETSDRVAAVRARLAASGELNGAKAHGRHYDPELVSAVKAWQSRNGLEEDGVIGRGTRAMLNIPVSFRIKQVIANMERLRWQPDDLGNRYVLVNIPAYQLVAMSAGHADLSMKVVVGRAARATPVFSDTIRMVEFNPSWHVPPTIAREDVLPHLRQDPHYALEHKNVRIYQDGVEIDPATVDWHKANIRDYRLTAPPGPRNPLGTVKFLFPNRFDVYLHDTSEPNLFAKTERAFSSGCVRVADPAALTNWLMSADRPDWTEQRRSEILESGKRRQINLLTPVPVYLSYHTAWRHDDGLPAFRQDIYGLDQAMIEGLDKVLAAPRTLPVSMMRAVPAVIQSPASPEPGQGAVIIPADSSLEQNVPKAGP